MKLTNCDQSFFKLFWKQLKRMKTYRHPVFLESSWTLATTWFFPKFPCCHPPRTLHLTLLTGSIFNCIGGGSGAALNALLNDMICYMFINPAGDSFTFVFIFFCSFIKPCIQNPCVQHSHFNVNVSLNFTPCGSKLCWWRLQWIQVMLCEGSARLYIYPNQSLVEVWNDLVQSFFFSPSPTSPSRQYRSLDRTSHSPEKP